jgi:hypothetical protein
MTEVRRHWPDHSRFRGRWVVSGKVYVRAVDRAGNISAPVSAGTEQHLVFLPFVIRG